VRSLLLVNAPHRNESLGERSVRWLTPTGQTGWRSRTGDAGCDHNVGSERGPWFPCEQPFPPAWRRAEASNAHRGGPRRHPRTLPRPHPGEPLGRGLRRSVHAAGITASDVANGQDTGADRPLSPPAQRGPERRPALAAAEALRRAAPPCSKRPLAPLTGRQDLLISISATWHYHGSPVC
jgi:hypothetical protein